MDIGITTRRIVTALAALALATAAPAAGGTGQSDPGRGPSAGGQAHGKVVFRRDGSQAVAFVSRQTPHRHPVFRRDGSNAVPFVAKQAAPGGAAEPSANGWAGVATVGVIGSLVAFGAFLFIRRRRTAAVRATVRRGPGPART